MTTDNFAHSMATGLLNDKRGRVTRKPDLPHWSTAADVVTAQSMADPSADVIGNKNGRATPKRGPLPWTDARDMHLTHGSRTLVGLLNEHAAQKYRNGGCDCDRCAR